MRQGALILFVVLVIGAGTARAQTPLPADPVDPAAPVVQTTVRITSPLGRTGLAGRIRIVAQVDRPATRRASLEPLTVRFSVDGEVVGTVDRPPYAVEWVDENPFEPREIVVEVEEMTGTIVHDKMLLPPFEIVGRTEVASILLEAGVYDVKTGRAVPGLGIADFIIRENDLPQAVDLVARESLPATMILLVDNSQSMRRRMDAVREAAERFARSLRDEDQVIVAPFNHQIGTMTGPTDDVATIVEAIGAIRAGGGTAILDAVDEATRLLEGTSGRRVILLITDGFDENSTTEVEAVIEAAQASQVMIYAVAVGGVTGVSLLGESVLRQLTEQTGGRVFFPWRESELAGVYGEVAADAHSRYLLTYTPTNQRQDGTWRAISVDAGEGHRVLTRTGYRAPAPPPIRPTLEFTARSSSPGLLDLTAADLAVIEDGVPQAVEGFQEAVDPVSIVMAIDTSGSMRRDADAVRETAREFVLAIRPEDPLALITFADDVTFAHVLDTNRDWSLEAIDSFTVNGGTALYDALRDSLLHLMQVKGRRVVVVLTDGKDENNPGTAPGSVNTFEDVLDLNTQAGAAIYTVGLGSGVDRPVLNRLAAESGGEAYYSHDPSQLGEQFRLIIEDMRRRYVVSYTSTNSDHDGAWRKVDIRSRVPGVTVVGEGGYFAPDW